jgi:hypothetical protein
LLETVRDRQTIIFVSQLTDNLPDQRKDCNSFFVMHPSELDIKIKTTSVSAAKKTLQQP